jgi:hypothetical protein
MALANINHNVLETKTILKMKLEVLDTCAEKSEVGLLNKSSCLAPALGVTKIKNHNNNCCVFSHTLLSCLSQT